MNQMFISFHFFPFVCTIVTLQYTFYSIQLVLSLILLVKDFFVRNFLIFSKSIYYSSQLFINKNRHVTTPRVHFSVYLYLVATSIKRPQSPSPRLNGCSTVHASKISVEVCLPYRQSICVRTKCSQRQICACIHCKVEIVFMFRQLYCKPKKH